MRSRTLLPLLTLTVAGATGVVVGATLHDSLYAVAVLAAIALGVLVIGLPDWRRLRPTRPRRTTTGLVPRNYSVNPASVSVRRVR